MFNLWIFILNLGGPLKKWQQIPAEKARSGEDLKNDENDRNNSDDQRFHSATPPTSVVRVSKPTTLDRFEKTESRI